MGVHDGRNAHFDLLSALAHLKRSSAVLSEFPRESRTHWLDVKNKEVFAFERRTKDAAVQGMVNLGEKAARLSGLDAPLLNNVVVKSSGVTSKSKRDITIPAWGYVVSATE